MNTTSEYVLLYQEVFGEYADTRKMVKYDFEDCVTHTKLWEWGMQINHTLILQQDSSLYKAIIGVKEKPKIVTVNKVPEKLWAQENATINTVNNLVGNLTGGLTKAMLEKTMMETNALWNKPTLNKPQKKHPHPQDHFVIDELLDDDHEDHPDEELEAW